MIFNFDRNANKAIVHDFLTAKDIHWAGRCSEWAYLRTDQSMLSGERAANEVRTALGLGEARFEERL